MANYQHKRSPVAGKTPLAGDLLEGEIAVNIKDRKLFAKDDQGTVFEFLGGNSGGVDTVNGVSPVAGNVTLDALNISPTADRLWMSQAERLKLSRIEEGTGTNIVTSVAGKIGDVDIDLSDIKTNGGTANNVVKAQLVAQGLSGNYGFFAEGFTYTNTGDVGIAPDNTIWTRGTGSATVNAGTTPTSPSYNLVELNSAEHIDWSSLGVDPTTIAETIVKTVTTQNNSVIRVTGWTKVADNVWQIAKPQGWVHALHVAGTPPNAYNKVNGAVNFQRLGDYTVSTTAIQLSWPSDPNLCETLLTMGASSSEADAGKRIMTPSRITGEIVKTGLTGFDIRAPSTIINSHAISSKYNGFDINSGAGEPTRLIGCSSEMCGQPDNGETSKTVGHGVLLRAPCQVVNHVSRNVAEDGYQIGTAIGDGGVPAGAYIEMIGCEAYNCYEDFLDIKETGEQLLIRGFKGWGCMDSAINYHPSHGTGLLEVTDSRFGGAVQMMRVQQVNASIPSRITSSRNIYDQRNPQITKTACMPALDWKASNTLANAELTSLADVFIGGGTRYGVEKAVVNVQGAGTITMCNNTIHVPGDMEHEDISSILIENSNVKFRAYNCCITKYSGAGLAYLIDIADSTTDVLIRDGVLWVEGTLGTTPYVRIAGVEYTEADIKGSSYGGPNNLIIDNVRIERMLTASPAYTDEPNGNLAPIWQTVHMNIHGRRQWAPPRDVLGQPFSYFSWMGGSPSESIGVGAYCSISSRIAQPPAIIY